MIKKLKFARVNSHPTEILDSFFVKILLRDMFHAALVVFLLDLIR